MTSFATSPDCSLTDITSLMTVDKKEGKKRNQLFLITLHSDDRMFSPVSKGVIYLPKARCVLAVLCRVLE